MPFEYIQQLESSSNAAPNSWQNIYAAPVLFEQDNAGVPGIVRATDYMWSGLAAQNLNSWFGVGFPISNYRSAGLAVWRWTARKESGGKCRIAVQACR